jgi:ABC-type uncharacterized transport system auxiliary subunit
MKRIVWPILLLLSGCSLHQPAPVKSFYIFETPALEPAAPSGGEIQTVRVARARVAPPFDSRALQYRVTENRIEPSYYHNWADDPGALVTKAILESLSTIRMIHVVDASSIAVMTRTLELYITEISVDVSTSNSVAIISLRATLLDPKGVIIKTFDLRRAEPAASGEAPDVVAAWDVALGEIIAELVSELLSQQPTKGAPS